MLSQALQEALNAQVNREFYSAYLYLAMAMHFENEGWPGFAHWMRLQAHEEQEHAERFYDYLLERNARVMLQAIAQPPLEFGTPLEVFKASYAHEQFITASIHAIYDLAVAEKDYATQAMLQWFVTEQVEEEKHVSDIVTMLERIGDKVHALIALDQQLGTRGK